MWQWWSVVAGALLLAGCSQSNLGKYEKDTQPLAGNGPSTQVMKSPMPAGSTTGAPAKGVPPKAGQPKTGQRKTGQPSGSSTPPPPPGVK